jgi:multidrug efflux pump subunit AcrA (membrane-fusion protein)
LDRLNWQMLARDVLNTLLTGLQLAAVAIHGRALCGRRTGGTRQRFFKRGGLMSRARQAGFMVECYWNGALMTACSADGKTTEKDVPPARVAVAPTAASSRPFARATGTLIAEEQADVAVETSGRGRHPHRAGQPRRPGAEPIGLSATETDAQMRKPLNASQIEARLGITPEAPFNANAVPEYRTRRLYDLAQSEFARVLALDQKVVSSEFDQRRTQVEAARQQFEASKNGAAQQYQALQAARARVSMARKALGDTVVRAPFNGLVAERLVSVGDYVTRGTKVAVVVRVNPLRAQLTVPEQVIRPWPSARRSRSKSTPTRTASSRARFATSLPR